ncbi:MAG: DUF975 family protein [Ruminococcaceae bacterium]|nr:DUF975 family protein [Oscillospiraceae bacterium]
MPDNKKKNKMEYGIRMLKRDAKGSLKRHYLFFVVACLLAVFMDAEFITSDYLINMRSTFFDMFSNSSITVEVDPETEEKIKEGVKALDSDAGVFRKNVEKQLEDVNRKIKSPEGSEVFGRSKGVLNQIIDFVAGDTFFSHMYSTISGIVGDPRAANIAIISLLAIVSFTYWLFVRNLFVAVIRRIFLEGRIYKKIPVSRYLFFIRMKRWARSAITMGLLWIIEFLSSFTIVLYPIVRFGFFLVPYIIAENPDIKTVDALKLSWRMMRGNKWTLFKIIISILGWNILNVFTLGVFGILYTNPYKICIYSEFYARVREAAKQNEIEGVDQLNDIYLFAKADNNRLNDAYADVLEELDADKPTLDGLKGRNKFIADHFGVVLWNTKDEMEYEADEERRVKLLAYKKEAEGESYPSRLSPIPEQRKLKSLAHIHYMRHYSLPSLAALFFIFAMFGWVWELFFYYVQQGKIINRGVLHGPWLPIYGVGGLIVLIFLFVLRRRPVLHLIATVILCGVVEYFGGWALETIFDKKWWDYSGYFFNIDGRVCAEGLFVFGAAGMAFIYVLAPLLDNMIRKARQKILIPVEAVLLVLFVIDVIYSAFVPNTGDGITGNFDKGDDPPAITSETLEQDR